MFKVGDEVVCTKPDAGLVKGRVYVVSETKTAIATGAHYIRVDGGGLYWWSIARFDLAPAAITDPETYAGTSLETVWVDELTEVQPETPEDPERAAQEKLRAYKREMRDWLYGTRSGETK